MRATLLGAALAFIGMAATAQSDHYVNGYFRANGTYVAPHYQTNPDGTRNDNYSTRGNVNPYTGQPGTKPRDGEYGAPAYGSSWRAPSPTYGSSYGQQPTGSSYGQPDPNNPQ